MAYKVNFVIRPANQEKDYKGIAKVHFQSWEETYRGLIPNSYLDKRSVEKCETQWKDILQYRSRSQESTFVAISDEGEIVGFINGENSRDKDLGFEAELCALYVLKCYQRKGLGRDLTEALMKYFAGKGMTSMYLWVLKDNPAVMAYQALGGEISEFSKTESIDGHDIEEIVISWKNFTRAVHN